MRVLCELTDQSVLGLPGRSDAKPRRTARAVLHNGEGLYALMYAARFDLYTLPGGGMEDGEDSLTALYREVLEETGCTCQVEAEIGCVSENRAHCDFTAQADYYLARATGCVQQPELTQGEAADGARVLWLPLEEVWQRITRPVHTTHQRRFLQARDRAALEAYYHMKGLTLMQEKTIYLAGGCYWGVEKYIANIRGVKETEVGFANGNTHHPTYQQVRYENTGHAETVRVVYDADVLPLPRLLELFFRIIDPVSADQQGEDVGHQYRTGVYHADPADAPVIADALAALEAQVGQPLAVEALPLEHFYPAEEYHQKYLDKNPGGYCHVPWDMINWVKTQQ